MLNTSAVVVGAGIVGLSIAYALQKSGITATVIEMQENLKLENHFRNSAVIHAGIYYPPQSLKAKHCREGAQLLFKFCDENSIDYKVSGKLIVATAEGQLATLASLKENALLNGVEISILSQKDISRIEPNIKCLAAVYSPKTSIINVSQYIQTLHKKFIDSGGEIFFQTEALSIDKDGEYVVECYSNNKKFFLRSNLLINSGGLYATEVSKRMNFLDKSCIPTTTYAKGNYFKLNTKNCFSTLIYPLPECHGLGIHATTDIFGNIRFGPDVQWIDNPKDFSVDVGRKNVFIENIQKWFPDIVNYNLEPEFAGIRPKINVVDKTIQDFMISTQNQHGHEGLINLYGIESPGLTSSLAIGNYIARYLSGQA